MGRPIFRLFKESNLCLVFYQHSIPFTTNYEVRVLKFRFWVILKLSQNFTELSQNSQNIVLHRWLIMFVEDPTEQVWKGYLYATLMLVAALFRSIFLNHGYFLQNQLFLKTQAALSPMVYRKVLSISSNARKGKYTISILLSFLNFIRRTFFFARAEVKRDSFYVLIFPSNCET